MADTTSISLLGAAGNALASAEKAAAGTFPSFASLLHSPTSAEDTASADPGLVAVSASAARGTASVAGSAASALGAGWEKFKVILEVAVVLAILYLVARILSDVRSLVA